MSSHPGLSLAVLAVLGSLAACGGQETAACPGGICPDAGSPGADATSDDAAAGEVTGDALADAADAAPGDAPGGDVALADAATGDAVAGDGGAELPGVDVVAVDVGKPSLKGTVFVNEIVAGGAKTPTTALEGDWAEFYNAGPTPADVSGCKLGGPTLGLPGALPLPAGTVIAPGGHLVVYFNHMNLGAPNINKNLGKTESLTMWDTSDVIVDSVAWTDTQSPTGSSYARTPDGGSIWKTVAPTPGTANPK